MKLNNNVNAVMQQSWKGKNRNKLSAVTVHILHLIIVSMYTTCTVAIIVNYKQH